MEDARRGGEAKLATAGEDGEGCSGVKSSGRGDGEAERREIVYGGTLAQFGEEQEGRTAEGVQLEVGGMQSMHGEGECMVHGTRCA